MASYDLNTLQDVLDAIDEEKQLDPGLVSPNEKRRYVQDALDDIGDLALFEKRVTATVTASMVDLATLGGTPTGYETIIGVYWNGRPLGPVDPRAIDQTALGNTPAGYWSMTDGLYLWPGLEATVSGELTVDMNYRPTWPATLGTVIDLPKEWRRLLVLYGTYRCHKKNGNTFSAREYQTDYENLKARLANLEIQRRNQRQTSVRQDNDTSGASWDALGRNY
jgi:hypothetical protein